MITTCFKRIEYATFKIKQTANTKHNNGFSIYETTKDATKITQPAVIAKYGFNAPDAIGRYRLTGCCRSASISIKSFKIQTQPDIAQNSAKQIAACATIVKDTCFIEKTNAANTSKFLVHCFGRNCLKNNTTIFC